MPYVQQLLHKTQANMLITHAQPNMKMQSSYTGEERLAAVQPEGPVVKRSHHILSYIRTVTTYLRDSLFFL